VVDVGGEGGRDGKVTIGEKVSIRVFQVLELFNRPPERKIPRAGLPVPPGPAVRLSERTQWKLIRSPLSGAVNQQLDVLGPRLEASIPPLGGALLRVSYHESKKPGADGKPEQRVAAVEILGTGRVPSLVVFIRSEE